MAEGAGRALRYVPLVLLLAVWLAGCNTTNTVTTPSGGRFFSDSPQPGSDVAAMTKIGLLLPRSGLANSDIIALSFQNAVSLALREYDSGHIQILAFDSKGTEQGGYEAARQAVDNGVSVILGPVFAAEVAGVRSVARLSGTPVLSFSTDSAVAAPGVFLTGFLPQNDVDRIIGYAAANGRGAFAALLPANAYGAVAEAAFRQAVGKYGGRVVQIARYVSPPPGALAQADDDMRATMLAPLRSSAATMAATLARADALFVPEGGAIPAAIAGALKQAGTDFSQLKMLGSGQWDTPEVLYAPDLSGSWYPGPDAGGFNDFAARYASVFGGRPPRNASIAYDAASLLLGLSRMPGQAGQVSVAMLTNPSGFRGVDGIFRLLADGSNQRGLAVWQLTGTEPREVSPAPTSFTRTGLSSPDAQGAQFGPDAQGGVSSPSLSSRATAGAHASGTGASRADSASLFGRNTPAATQDASARQR